MSNRFHVRPRRRFRIPVHLPPPEESFFVLGTNAAGLEFASEIQPSQAEFDYFLNRGWTRIRLPFKWSRVQPTLNGPLAAGPISRIQNCINFATARGMEIILDAHDFGGHTSGAAGKVGGPTVTIAHFVDFWQRMHAEFGAEAAVRGYDLMNEWSVMPDRVSVLGPGTNTDVTTSQTVFDAQQAVITALRGDGCDKFIYIEGNHWSSSWCWETANPTIHLLDDPLDKLVFSAHSYADRDNSGTRYVWATEAAATGTAPNGTNVTTSILVDRITPFTDWLTTHGLQGHIGELGVPGDADEWLETLENGIAHVRDQNHEFTYWASGQAWGTYPFNAYTIGGRQARQTVILNKFTGKPDPLNYFLFAPPVFTEDTESSNFTVDYRGELASAVTVTPSDDDGGGTFTPATVELAAGYNPTATFTYTPGTSGTKSISVTNDGGLTDPSAVAITVAGAVVETFPWVGVNVAGLEFSSATKPGVEGANYFAPLDNEGTYWLSRGFNCIRLPVLAERAIPALGSPLDETYMGHVDNAVDIFTSRGMILVLDCHNYGQYYGVDWTEETFLQWWQPIIERYADNPLVVFDTQNEPGHLSALQMVTFNNALIAWARGEDVTNWIMVEVGSSASRADTLEKTGNEEHLLLLEDPLDKIIIQLHSYVDSQGSGTTAGAVAGTGRGRLTAATRWARDRQADANITLRLFLGERGISTNATNRSENIEGFKYMASRPQWVGWSMWSAGRAYNDFFVLHPTGGLTIDRSGVVMMRDYLPEAVLNRPPTGVEFEWQMDLVPTLAVGTVVAYVYAMDPNPGAGPVLTLTSDGSGQFELVEDPAMPRQWLLKVAAALIAGDSGNLVVAIADVFFNGPPTTEPYAVAASPADLSLITNWWDVTTGIAESGGFVDTWTDKIAGRVLTATGTARPAHGATAWDGSKPALTGDGSNDVMTATGPVVANQCAIIVAERGTQTDGSNRNERPLFAFKSGQGKRMLHVMRPTSDPDQTQVRVGTSTAAVSTEEWAIDEKAVLTGRWSNSAGKMVRVNNVGEVTGDAVYGENDGLALSLFGDSSVAIRRFAGKISHLVIFSSQPSDAELAFVQSYFENGGWLAAAALFAPVVDEIPTVTGTAQVGETLTCDPGTADSNPTPTETYQWQRGTTNIADATAATYVPVAGDVGNTLRCRVTWTNSQGAVQTFSANTMVVISAAAFADQFFTANVADAPWYGGHTHPPCEYIPETDTLSLTWEAYTDAMGRHVRGRAIDLSSEVAQDEVIISTLGLVNDDHGVPARCRASNGHHFCFNGAHNGNMRVQSTNAPDDLSAWTQRTAIPGLNTYPKPVPVGDGIHLLMRVKAANNKMPLVLRTTTSIVGGVASWSGAKTLIDLDTDSRVYAGTVLKVGEDRIHFVATRANWSDTHRRNVYYFVYETDTGDIVNFDGTARHLAASLPITLAEANADFRLYTHTTTTGRGLVHCFDTEGHPHVLFLDNTILKHIWHNGTAWQTPNDVRTGLTELHTPACYPLPDGEIAVVWPEDPLNIWGNAGNMVRAIWDGAAWGSPTTIVTAGQYAYAYATAVLNGTAKARIAFAELGAPRGQGKAFVFGDTDFLEMSNVGVGTLTDLGKVRSDAAYPANVWAMSYPQDGKIYCGTGNSSNFSPNVNAGSGDLKYIDTVDDLIKTSSYLAAAIDDEQISTFHVFDGELVFPGIDPRGAGAVRLHKLSGGSWSKYTVSSSAEHCFDVRKFDDEWFAALGTSDDLWSDLFRHTTVADGTSGWVEPQDAGDDIGARINHLFEHSGQLYASGSVLSSPARGIYRWNGAKFIEAGLSRSLLFPGLTSDPHTYQISRSESVGTHLIYIAARTHNDSHFHPYGLFVAAAAFASASAVALQPNELPWDLKKDGSTAYVLTSRLLSTGPDVFRIRVLSSVAPFTVWTEVLAFEYATFARSFSFTEDAFFFGMGTDWTTAQAAAAGFSVSYTGTLKAESGTILKWG